MLKSRQRFRVLPAFALLAMVAACGSDVAGLPALQTQGFLPEIRDRIEKAHKAALEDPLNAQASGKVGMTLQAHGEHAQAGEWYSRAAALAPGEFRWRYYRAAAEIALGNESEALAHLREALAINKGYLPARLALAQMLLDAGETREARRHYEAIAEEFPDLAQAWYGLGQSRAASDDFAGAQQALERAVDVFPQYGRALFSLGEQYRRSGSVEAARKFIEQAERNPNAAPPLEDPLLDEIRKLAVSSAHFMEESQRLQAAGRLAEAAEALEMAARVDPSSPQPHTNLIALYAQLGRPDQAERSYRLAVALHPDEVGAHYNYGILANGLENFDEARKAFERVIEINPRDANSYFQLAATIERSGNPAAALQYFLRAAKEQPGFREAHYHAGRLLAARGRYADAIRQFRQTLEPEDNSTPQFLYGLAMAHGGSGDVAAATTTLQRAQRLAKAQGQADLAAELAAELDRVRPAR